MTIPFDPSSLLHTPRTPIDMLKRVKREWAPDTFNQGSLYNADYTQACFFGKCYQIDPAAVHQRVVGEMIEAKIKELYPEDNILALKQDKSLVVLVNDGPNGYEKIMNVIDAVLLDQLASTETTVAERELVQV